MVRGPRDLAARRVPSAIGPGTIPGANASAMARAPAVALLAERDAGHPWRGSSGGGMGRQIRHHPVRPDRVRRGRSCARAPGRVGPDVHCRAGPSGRGAADPRDKHLPESAASPDRSGSRRAVRAHHRPSSAASQPASDGAVAPDCRDEVHAAAGATENQPGPHRPRGGAVAGACRGRAPSPRRHPARPPRGQAGRPSGRCPSSGEPRARTSAARRRMRPTKQTTQPGRTRRARRGGNDAAEMG